MPDLRLAAGKSRLLSFTLLCLCLLACSSAGAATLEGLEFDDAIRLGNRDLRLNGLGVRKLFFIKAYVAGLYLGEKTSTAQEAVLMAGPKRLQLRMLRGAGPDDFNSALVAGVRDNSGSSERIRLAERVSQLEQTVRSIGSTVQGDVITLDYVPELGTRLAVNGATHGKAIAGADFYAALLAIFVGEKPVDSQLKRGLLGQ